MIVKTLKCTLPLVLIVALLLSPFVPAEGVQAAGENWLDGWTYRKQITLTGSTVGPQTDYTTSLTVNYGPPGSRGDPTGISYSYKWVDVIDDVDSHGQGGECDGTYLWTIPNTPSTQCLVMVTNSGDLTVFDTSDSIFTITDDTLARSITILYPVGGELLTIGSDVSILWNSTNVDYIDIEYSTNFGADWVTEADSIVSTGIYTFTVPDDSSYDCLLKITDALDDSVYDISDGNFGFIPNAPYVRVVQPNGGEELLAGMAYDIIWTHYNIPDEFPEFTIYYSTNSGDSWEIEYVNYGDTCYNWTVPADTSLECLVKIEWFDSLTFYPSARRGLSPEDDDGTYFVDFSDMCFSIVSELGIRFGERFPDESILRTYPNPFNSSVSIYAPENANIEIFDINGRMVEKIPTSPLNNRSAERKKTGGSFIWSPDKSLGSGVYLVRAKIGDEKITKRVVYLK